MSSPVALELSGGRRRCRGRNHNSRRGGRRRRSRGNRHGRRAVGTFVILQVRVPAQRGEDQQHGDVFHRVIPGLCRAETARETPTVERGFRSAIVHGVQPGQLLQQQRKRRGLQAIARFGTA